MEKSTFAATIHEQCINSSRITPETHENKKRKRKKKNETWIHKRRRNYCVLDNYGERSQKYHHIRLKKRRKKKKKTSPHKNHINLENLQTNLDKNTSENGQMAKKS